MATTSTGSVSNTAAPEKTQKIFLIEFSREPFITTVESSLSSSSVSSWLPERSHNNNNKASSDASAEGVEDEKDSTGASPPITDAKAETTTPTPTPTPHTAREYVVQVPSRLLIQPSSSATDWPQKAERLQVQPLSRRRRPHEHSIGPLLSTSDSSGTTNTTSSSTHPTWLGSGVLRWMMMIWEELAFWVVSLQQVLTDLFLPRQYPHSVRAGYLSYQVYDSIQGLCSYIRSVLSSARVLAAVGVGSAQATALSAAWTWALRDGVGMVSGLIFAYVTAPVLDGHVKEFRFFADMINNVALTLDMLSPMVGITTTTTTTGSSLSYAYLILSSASTVGKTLCGMAAGATKGSITLHFAQQGNMADLNAKEATQETMVSLLGMILGMTLTRLLQQQQQQQQQQEAAAQGPNDVGLNVRWTVWRIQWAGFIGLTMIHIVANWRAVQVLRLRTVNRSRAICALQPWLQAWPLVGPAAASSSSPSRPPPPSPPPPMKLLPPHLVQESLWESFYHLLVVGKWHWGVGLTEFIQADPTVAPHLLWWRQEQSRSTPSSTFSPPAASVRGGYLVTLTPRRGHVYVALLTGATWPTQWQAFVHAQWIWYQVYHGMNAPQRQVLLQDHSIRLAWLQQSYQLLDPYGAVEDAPSSEAAMVATKDHPISSKDETALSTQSSCPSWQALLEAGWDVQDRLYLGASTKRSQWYAPDDHDKTD